MFLFTPTNMVLILKQKWRIPPTYSTLHYHQAILGSASAIFGMLFAEFLTETHTSSTLTAWIHNLAFVLSCYCTFLLDPLVEEYGWRKVTLVMSLMRSLGLALSAFAPSAYFLFFSYTIFAGEAVKDRFSLQYLNE